MQLTETELAIVRVVIQRFVNLKEQTTRKSLVVKFRCPKTIDDMCRRSLLRGADLHSYVPTCLAFENSGDPAMLQVAKGAVAIVLHTLSNLFEVDAETRGHTCRRPERSRAQDIRQS
jgi:hypothetical protein